MDPSLAIEKRRFVVHGNDCAVPDIRVQIQAPGAIAPKADEFLRRDVIAGKRERYDETGAVHREEQLTAIGMIVGAPDQSAFTSVIRRRCGNLFRPIAPTEQVAVADGIVRRVERFSMPPKFEQSFGYTPLIARVGVDLTPALSGPANDFDRKGIRIIDQAPVAFEICVGRGQQGCFMHAAHTRRGFVRNFQKRYIDHVDA